jgi:hypothetical protein
VGIVRRGGPGGLGGPGEGAGRCGWVTLTEEQEMLSPQAPDNHCAPPPHTHKKKKATSARHSHNKAMVKGWWACTAPHLPLNGRRLVGSPVHTRVW